MRRKIILAASVALLLAGCTERPEPVAGEVTAQESSSSYVQTETAESGGEKEPEPEDELCDTSPISQAYLNGDTSGLDEEQIQVLEKASQVIDEIITDDMTDYEKELAVHDYIISETEYDPGMLGVFETPSYGSDTPYGTLCEHKAICKGYTTTFQLLMDMLEIECISIYAADEDGDNHAWNQVRIGDKYYYVDVTWDDPVPDVKDGMIRHDYFNVSEAEMKKRHIWDSSDMPSADGGEDSYIAHNLYEISDYSQVKEIMEQRYGQRAEETYFRLKAEDMAFLDKVRQGRGVAESKLPDELRKALSAFAKAHDELEVYCECGEENGEKLLIVCMQKWDRGMF